MVGCVHEAGASSGRSSRSKRTVDRIQRTPQEPQPGCRSWAVWLMRLLRRGPRPASLEEVDPAGRGSAGFFETEDEAWPRDEGVAVRVEGRIIDEINHEPVVRTQ